MKKRERKDKLKAFLRDRGIRGGETSVGGEGRVKVGRAFGGGKERVRRGIKGTTNEIRRDLKHKVVVRRRDFIVVGAKETAIDVTHREIGFVASKVEIRKVIAVVKEVLKEVAIFKTLRLIVLIAIREKTRGIIA